MSERSTCFPPNPLYDSQMGWEAITHLEFPICNLWSQQDNTLTQSRVLIKSYSQMKNLTAINSHNWNAYPERYGHGYWSFSTMRESELHLLQPGERLRCLRLGRTSLIYISLLNLSYSRGKTARISCSESTTKSVVGTLIFKVLAPCQDTWTPILFQ